MLVNSTIFSRIFSSKIKSLLPPSLAFAAILDEDDEKKGKRFRNSGARKKLDPILVFGNTINSSLWECA